LLEHPEIGHDLGMRGFVSICLGVSLAACGLDPDPQPLAGPGGSCDVASDCEAPLSCIENTCVDDRGPALSFVFPAALDAVDFGATLSTYVYVADRQPDDVVEFTFDPFGPSPLTTILEWTFSASPDYHGTDLTTPPQAGAYWLRARVLDADGKPYDNPSATQYVMTFVRDELHPDKPIVTLLEPRPDQIHPAGTPLSYTVAVLPGSFSFSQYSSACHPLDNCDDPFAPECADTCGPISRSGEVLLYLDQDLPECATELPGCLPSYISIPEEQLDAFIVRGEILPTFVETPGRHTLSAMLSYDYAPYPTANAPIFTSQTLDIE
jgi:hypothetical protein